MKDITMRDAFFDKLYEIARRNKNIILISADMGAPSLDKFRRDLSAQFINVGIAEGNMVTIATGLALSGKKVFMYAIMPFITSRCYEMLKLNLSLMNIAITAIGVGAGFGYNDSGPTHHCTEDVSIMRVLPNMTILSPSDTIMAAKFAEVSCKISSPSYVRLDRQILPIINNPDQDFSTGITNFKTGKDICIIATGNMVHRALEVSEKLADHSSIDAGVIDLYRLKPINEKLLLENIAQAKKIVTLEEHLIAGGLGSAILEIMANNDKILPIKRIGVQDKYIYAYGSRENIQSLCGLDTDSATKAILDWIK